MELRGTWALLFWANTDLGSGSWAQVPLAEPFLLPSVDYETFDILEDEEVRQFSFLPGGWCERG